MPEINMKELFTLMLLSGDKGKEEVDKGDAMIIQELEMLRKMLEDAPLGGITHHMGGG